MEEIKQGWKKRAYWLFIAIVVVVVYKILDNYTSVQAWLGSFFSILRPFLIGLLIAYILFMPCRKIEDSLKKSKSKFLRKRSRGISVITTYLIFILVIIILINVIFPILSASISDLISNIPNYYYKLLYEYDNLPDDSILKSEAIEEQISTIREINIAQFFAVNHNQIMAYVKNVINIFSGIIDVFIAIVVSVYILLQRTAIVGYLRKFARAIFSKEKYETFDKYFTKANEVFFTFISSQLLDAFIVGILATIAMLILGVKYAPLLGFTIGLFNMIPYIGAIVAVGLAVIITFITGGFGKALVMFIVVLILQQIDANIINPRILKNALKTSPLLTLFSISIGGAYFGVVGMFLAVPIAVVLKSMLDDYIYNKNKIRDEEELNN